ncbi:MAG: addiction module protein [Gemmataceae bacterium]
MSDTLDSLKSAAGHLTSVERVELVQFLIHFDQTTDEDIETNWDLELARQEAEIESGIADGKSIEEVFTQIRERYK